MTSGSPIRGTEILTLKIKNQKGRSLRNIYINKKSHLIMLNTEYYKGFLIIRDIKPNIRFLTPNIN